MITKKQYSEILDVLEKYLKLQENNKVILSKDYQFGFITVINVIKTLVEK